MNMVSLDAMSHALRCVASFLSPPPPHCLHTHPSTLHRALRKAVLPAHVMDKRPPRQGKRYASATRRAGLTLASSALAFAAASAAACAPHGRQTIISALFLWTDGSICQLRRLLAIDIHAPSLPTPACLPALCYRIIITAMHYLFLLCLLLCRRVFRCLLGRRLQSHSNRTCHRTVWVGDLQCAPHRAHRGAIAAAVSR